MSRPVIGVFGLTGCAGDQLVLLDCEDELLEIVATMQIVDFSMISSDNDTASPLDIAFVEGAVSTAEDEARLRSIRERAGLLVALGTCAVWGGLARLHGELQVGRRDGPAGNPASDSRSGIRALHEIVRVDFRISGCPVEKGELLAALAHLANGNPPLQLDFPLCGECRMKENNCLLLQRGEICCGPLTVAGCGARCPALGVSCIGCRGPASDANAASALAMFEEKGVERAEITRRLRSFAPLADGEIRRAEEAV